MAESPVRGATEVDLPAIAEIHVRAWRSAYRGILPDAVLDALSVEERATRWRRWLVSRASRTLVVERDRVVVGFTRSSPSDLPATAEVSHLYLEPSLIGGGLGRALLEAIVDRARRDGYGQVSLWVLEDNHRARRFYDRARFVPDGARQTDPTFLGNDAAELRYRLAL